jgi:hypothetical protein
LAPNSIGLNGTFYYLLATILARKLYM